MSFLVDYKPQNTNDFKGYVSGLVTSAKQGFVDKGSMVKTTYPTAPGLNTTALGAPGSTTSVTGSGLDSATPSYLVGGVGGGYGGGGSSGSTWDDVMQLISDTAKANNEWSAQQAQKQMDFQERMSSTAHQREVEDLQKAGLNPVLSAGGNGASTPNGAMGDTDTSNTRLLAEIASQAVQSLGMTAAGYAGAAAAGAISKSSDSFLTKATKFYTTNKLGKKVIDTGLGIASSAAKYAMLGKLALFV